MTQLTFQVILTLMSALIGMAFLTLLERKILAYAQLRKGPNKTGLIGLPQPFADAMKLLTKGAVNPSLSNHIPFLLAPTIALSLSMTLWHLYPTLNSATHKPLGILLFISVSAMTVYTVIMAGWASNSKYALMGAMRAMAQTISYEIAMVLLLLFFSVLASTLDLTALQKSNTSSMPGALTSWPLILMWIAVMMAETNRAPFDFAEGESELVSGFNVEYSGAKFAIFFMAEYLNMLLMSLVTSALFIGTPHLSFIFTFLFLWARATLPRHRYDLMMYLAWKSFLPTSLAFLIATVLPITLTML
uniref:NADH-ubiquinone oxidoreductase chain 1 n=1 Tax=Margaritifera margaritifera TaxID=2505931 RepID=A0A4Y5QSG4_9BIVA|nr:NADH dehydrogenase subunit 1 [Margaritifera margaritifera]